MAHALKIISSASQDRLEKLIEERLKPETDTAEIDKRIWDLFGEKWAVMFTDLSGFSRKVSNFGIIHFLQLIHESMRILVPVIDNHDGILLKTEGDSMMIIFRNVYKAVDCAVAMQKKVKQYNEEKSELDDILLCIGLGYGPMLKIGDHDVFGKEVNAASKLGEDTAKAWEILITDSVKYNLDKEENPYKYNIIKEIPPGAKAAYSLKYNI